MGPLPIYLFWVLPPFEFAPKSLAYLSPGLENGVGGCIEKVPPVSKTEVVIERRGTPPPSSEDSSWGDESVADQGWVSLSTAAP